jgi:hypothetical protein
MWNKFLASHGITSVIFILIYCLGWPFQDTLITNLNLMTTGIILLINLITGRLRYKFDSLYSGITFLLINNLYSSVVIQ